MRGAARPPAARDTRLSPSVPLEEARDLCRTGAPPPRSCCRRSGCYAWSQPVRYSARQWTGNADGCSRRSSAREAHDRRRAPPEFLQAVVFPFLGREEVDDDVAEVDEYPAALLCPLLVARGTPRLLQLVTEPVGDGRKLEGRARRRQHEIVGKAGRAGDIEQRDVLGLEIGEQIDDAVGEGLGVQGARSSPRAAGRTDGTTAMSAPRVVCAMSGGVDSSVAAALLVEQGYEVVGVTMRLWTEERPDELRGHQQCCSVEDIDDARRVAGQLGIRHYVLNFEDAFRERVVDPFVAEYARGRTPNPCARCNEHIKYRALLDRLPAFDAAFLATGHYARVAHGEDGVPHRLLRGVDGTKDQSYVLYMLGQEQLRRLLLPVGALRKEEVRAVARRAGLDVAEKPDSVEICFVPGNDYRAFVAERSEPRPGELRSGDGAVLGRHRGVSGFTVGQRKGLGVTLGEPRYVTAIDAAANVIVVGKEEDLFADHAAVESVSWVVGAPPPPGEAIAAKARYKAEAAPATLVSIEGDCGDRAVVRFERRQRALTPGQTIAFYCGEAVLGGGTIARAWRG